MDLRTAWITTGLQVIIQAVSYNFTQSYIWSYIFLCAREKVANKASEIIDFKTINYKFLVHLDDLVEATKGFYIKKKDRLTNKGVSISA